MITFKHLEMSQYDGVLKLMCNTCVSDENHMVTSSSSVVHTHTHSHVMQLNSGVVLLASIFSDISSYSTQRVDRVNFIDSDSKKET